VVLPEIIRVLCTASEDDISLAIEVIKMIDFSICVLPSEFHVFRWVFFDDQGNVQALPDRKKQFMPLVRAMHAVVPTHVKLNLVRRDIPATASPATTPISWLEAAGRPSSLLQSLNQPLLSIPERCYYDLRSLEPICAALSRISTATTDGAVEDDDLLFPSSGAPEDEDHPGVVRSGDGFDERYAMWLLEAEFLHVGVAASEQQLATLGRMMQSGGSAQHQNPTSPGSPVLSAASPGPFRANVRSASDTGVGGSSRPTSPDRRGPDSLRGRDDAEDFVEVN
jgi:hypothetical protein